MNMIDGMMDALKLGTKVTKILEKLAYDAGIKEQMETEGYTDGVFTIGNKRVSFRVENLEKRVMDAEIIERPE